jgi:hypothetical protein
MVVAVTPWLTGLEAPERGGVRSTVVMAVTIIAPTERTVRFRRITAGILFLQTLFLWRCPDITDAS